MKLVKGYLMFFLFLLVVPFANAELGLYDFSSKTYSLGDVVLFSGHVIYQNNTRANLELSLSCDGKSEQVAAELLDLKANEKVEFSTYVNLPINLFGNCLVNLELVDESGNILDSVNYQGFNLTNDLEGNFEISKNNFQLGEALNLNGFVKKPGGSAIDGVALIYFKQNSFTKFLGTGEVIDGSFFYSKELIRIPPGEYKITIFVTDNFGNKHIFEDVLSVNIKGDLEIITNLQKSSYDPGDTLTLSGHVNSNLGVQLSDILLEVDFGGGAVVSQTLKNNNAPFTVSYSIPTNVKTKVYSIGITAKNKIGNYGFKEIVYSVNPIPSLLELSLQGGGYNPEEDVKFSLKLLDQAGDSIQENINVDLLDPDSNVASSIVIETGTSGSIRLPQYAEPGSWKLLVSAFGLQDEVSVNVNEYKKVNAEIKGTEVVVKNIGNIPFKEELGIEAGDLKKSKKISLSVGESKNIKLDKLFPPGSYQVKLPSLGKIFDNVIIAAKKSSLFGGLGKLTGNVAKNVENPGRMVMLFVALTIFGISLVYLTVNRRTREKRSQFKYSSTDKDYVLGQRKLQELKAKGIRKDPPNYGKATQEDVEYWKKKVQDTFREQEQKKANSEFLHRQQRNINDDKPKPGLFNMFG